MKHQKGFTLVVTMILLMVAAVIGLYAMRSAITEDKMSANMYNKTITTNTAETGATVFYQWISNTVDNHDWPTSDSDKAGWKAVIPYTALGTPNFGDNGYYWINPTETVTGCAVANKNPCWNDTTNEVIALITGNLLKGDNTSRVSLGESKVLVHIQGKELTLPEMPAALTFAGDVSNYQGGNSNVYKIKGGSKYAIATSSDTSATTIKNGIPNNRLDSDHYGGSCDAICIGTQNLGIWGKPDELSSYLDTLSQDSRVQVVEGNLTGNLPCSGVVIVKGSVLGNGNMSGPGCNNEFHGVLIVLGGTFDVSGGGPLDIYGAVYVANLSTDPLSGKKTFKNNPSTFKGGGNFTINYNNRFFGGSHSTNESNTAKISIKNWANVL